MEGFKREGGQKLILLFMHAGVKRNLSKVEGQSLPRNPTDLKCSCRASGWRFEFLLSIVWSEGHGMSQYNDYAGSYLKVWLLTLIWASMGALGDGDIPYSIRWTVESWESRGNVLFNCVTMSSGAIIWSSSYSVIISEYAFHRLLQAY